jgi:hypothetical protein
MNRLAALAGTAVVVLATASTAGAIPNGHSALPTWHVTITATFAHHL